MTISNKVGNVVEVPRNTVDDNWRLDCSSGLHVGSIEYVRNFCANDQNRVVIVKVNPADVVAVPEYECTKLRTCKYEVVGEYDAALLEAMPETLHTAAGAPIMPTTSSPTLGWEELDDEDDDDDDGSELDEEEYDEDEDKEQKDIIDRLVAIGQTVKLDPLRLAYKLNIYEFVDTATLRDVITEAVVNEDQTEVTIRRAMS